MRLVLNCIAPNATGFSLALTLHQTFFTQRSMFRFIFLVSTVCLSCVFSFPSGAPHDSCESLNPERGHKAASLPVAYAPFSVVASTRKVVPGERVGVEIFQRESKATFKGFLVQALDARTHQPIGQFVPTHGMKLLKECSAVSHSDPRPKKAVNLVWEAPYDYRGEVIFRATIVEHKQVFYANILAHNADEYYSSK